MTSVRPYIFTLSIAFSWGFCAYAMANESIPSHCKENEVAFFNARFESKIASLCGDQKTEPLKKMIYRYGAIGKIEINLVASTQNKAGIVLQSDGASHTGLASIRFYKLPYAYEVSEGLGMTTGVRLTIFKNEKPVASFKSEEYESRLVEINFDKVSSPIFQRASPLQPW
ncbi:hypothetical protein [Azovibrio restrictus]|uniref:hypothetical protein n=1 Tax=Azovibrio restrictus TaxID=146938 RepID=UPI0012ECAF66|nr:hypothetical protein [Azovibrio restrictus]